jgi:opacity protein-like surface antigen
MKRFAFALALFAVLATSGVAQAAFEKGNWDLTLSGSGANDKDFNDGSFALTLAPGVFISDEIEVGLRQNLSYSDGFAGSTTVFADYNFNHIGDGKLVPFVGLAVGYSYGENR